MGAGPRSLRRAQGSICPFPLELPAPAHSSACSCTTFSRSLCPVFTWPSLGVSKSVSASSRTDPGDCMWGPRAAEFSPSHGAVEAHQGGKGTTWRLPFPAIGGAEPNLISPNPAATGQVSGGGAGSRTATRGEEGEQGQGWGRGKCCCPVLILV